MPQLMPLMWVYSVIMVVIMIIMMIDMFYYSNVLMMKYIDYNNQYNIVYLW